MHLESSAHSAKRRRHAAAAGFTLIELVVVVVIIGILAGLAIPLITQRMRDRRTNEAAQRVALLFQQARSRAMGRGSAILIRFTDTGNGQFEMREAQRGPETDPDGNTDTTCSALPASSCLNTDWTNAANQRYRVVQALNLTNRGEYQLDTTFELEDSDGNSLTTVDFCFTPSGRAFSRENFAAALTPLSAAYEVVVERTSGAGITRRVLLLPNGAARLN